MTTQNQDLREQAEKALQEQDWRGAEAALRLLWTLRPGAASAQLVLKGFERIGENVRFPNCRVRMLRSFTLEPALPQLAAAGYAHGLAISTSIGGLNAYAQEILNPDDAVYTSAWEAVILAVHTRDIAPCLWAEANAGVPGDFRAEIEEVVSHFAKLIETFRERSTVPLVIHTLETPPLPMDGVFEYQRANGQFEAIAEVNRRLIQLAGGQKSVYILNYDNLVARYGRERWGDERMWLSAKLPFSAAAILSLVKEWLKFLCPLGGRLCKVLVSDLDNTLWGGVLGEEGLAGIGLDNRYPGAAYLAVQRALLDLQRRGILLAIASKNNEADAMAALDGHANMLIRREHLAAWRINWSDKAESLRGIAAELNLGLDSIAFLDDNPMERARVRSELPEVTVLEVGDDPFTFAPAVREAPELQRLELTNEDIERPHQYTEQRLRAEAQQAAPSLESFYWSLKQTVAISPVTPATALRVAQLTQKTNQFNTTTRRYTESQIAALANRPDWEIFAVRSADKFGDNGLIGVAMTTTSAGTCEVDTLLLSCRVISRTIETAILAFLVERCRVRGIQRLQGWIIPSPKNQPVRSVFEQHGFQKIGVDGEGTLWSLDLTTATVRCPEWIGFTAPQEQALVEHAS